jgi:hypothetical protein
MRPYAKYSSGPDGSVHMGSATRTPARTGPPCTTSA